MSVVQIAVDQMSACQVPVDQNVCRPNGFLPKDGALVREKKGKRIFCLKIHQTSFQRSRMMRASAIGLFTAVINFIV
jgi:hypothetical protein